MKFGLRKQSLNKRIAARTSVKRVVRHNLGIKAPRGWGWLTNPKKAAYNRVYSRTTKGCMVLILPIIFFGWLAFSLFGCEADCVNCSPNGQCIDGVCVCDRGFEGTDCGFLIRDRYTGAHLVSDTCNGQPVEYFVAVAPDSTSPYVILIGNLSNRVTGFSAELDGNSINIPAQTKQSQSGSVSVSGNGVLTQDGMRLTYSYFDGLTTDSCQCTTQKQ